jgi:hypothetical protein
MSHTSEQRRESARTVQRREERVFENEAEMCSSFFERLGALLQAGGRITQRS